MREYEVEEAQHYAVREESGPAFSSRLFLPAQRSDSCFFFFLVNFHSDISLVYLTAWLCKC